MHWVHRCDSTPTANQRITYSGHKRVHCLKFQVWCMHILQNLMLLPWSVYICCISHTVCSYSKWPYRPFVRAYWRETTWCFHAVCKWATEQADTFYPAQQQSICVVWGSSIWSIHPHPVSFPWPALNTTATGVQPSHECCAGVCRVDLWEDYTVFRISGLQEESESLVATSWQVLPCRGNSNELSHVCMDHNQQLFWCTTSIIRDLSVKLLM